MKRHLSSLYNQLMKIHAKRLVYGLLFASCLAFTLSLFRFSFNKTSNTKSQYSRKMKQIISSRKDNGPSCVCANEANANIHSAGHSANQREIEKNVNFKRKIQKIKVSRKENHFMKFTPQYKNQKNNSGIKLCPLQSALLQGHIDINISDPKVIEENGILIKNWPMSFEEIAAQYPELLIGGHYPGPTNCLCRSYNAIIVPYRNREKHLRHFLYYIHQLLQRQQLCYVVIVVEQDDSRVFNKGQLMNTAFKYAKESSSFDCYIFHDVDIIAEDDRILYACRDKEVVHLAPYIDKFEYIKRKGITVGAAVAFTEKQYVIVNGFSNEFAGWGGEDDDMNKRIESKEIEIWRSNENYTRFKMIAHSRDAGNVENDSRYTRLYLSPRRFHLDGLASLDTEITDVILYKTHLRLKVKTYQTMIQRDLDNRVKKSVRPYQFHKGIAIQKEGIVLRVYKNKP